MSELQSSEVPVSNWRLIERIDRLRVKAWEEVVGTVEWMTSWLNAIDAVARHWVFLSGEDPVAAARLSVHQTRLLLS